ncbi:MAG: FAD-dependent oxidoreductase [Beijerinckiaceae bacterium]
MARLTYDICVIGAGSAGLSVAAGTAQLGLDTILVERGKMGGECLNSGCVPSKAFLSLSKHVGHDVASTAGRFQFSRVKDGIQAAIDDIAPHDSVERFEGLGVRVLQTSARFVDSNTLQAGEVTISARRFVIATGSRPALPDVPGFDSTKILTNENIFALRDRPDHLVILGGGPIGIEMALAHRRLGIAVTVIQRSTILPHDEAELVAILRVKLEASGICLLEQASVRSAFHDQRRVELVVERAGATERIVGSHLLVATGRQPNIDDLGLDDAGVRYGSRGIVVDARLRTSQRHIFALGDAIDGPRFTHAAGYQAGIVIRNVAFRIPAKVDYAPLPWATYTDPELAHVGLGEAVARTKFGKNVRTVLLPLGENDRAVTERRTDGAIKIVVGPRGRILGASILAPAAGEMIGMWCLAISRKLTLRAIAGMTLPYPTFGEIGKAAAGRYYAPALFSDRTRRIVRFLQWLPM